MRAYGWPRGEAIAREGMRFVVAGSAASAVNWLSRLGASFFVPFPVALLVGAGLGLGFGFVLYRSWVFPGSARPLRAQTAWFLAVNAMTATVVFLAALALAYLLADLPVSLRNQQNLAHALAIGCGAGVSFIGHRTFTFAQRPERTVHARLVPAPDWIGPLVIVAAVALHRGYVLWTLGPLLDQAAVANADWLTFQYLLLPAYHNYLLPSLWYLQQTPPIPHVFLGALVKFADWPVGVARGLYLLQAAITIGTAVLLARLLRRLSCGAVISLVVPLYFALSTDVLLLEITSFGQLIYETGGMLLATAACLLVCGAFDRSGKPRELSGFAAAGAVTALAALTRASLSYLFAPLLVVILLKAGVRRALVFLAPVLLLHGAWALKNLYVYDYLTAATSSWAGMNATAKLSDPMKQELLDTITRADSTSPEWIKAVLRQHGYVAFLLPFARELLPDALRRREQEIDDRLGGTNRLTNTIAVQQIAAEYWRAFKSIAPAHAYELLVKFEQAYKLYWQPLSAYSAMFVGPLFVEPRSYSLFSLRALWPHEQARVVTAPVLAGQSADAGRPVDVNLPSVPLRALDVLCIWTLHIVLPLVLLADLVRRVRRQPPILDAKLVLLLALSLYGSILFNAFEQGENMRFRAAVTPINIALAFGVLAALSRSVRARRA